MTPDPAPREGEAPAEPDLAPTSKTGSAGATSSRILLWPLAHPRMLLAITSFCTMLAVISTYRIPANGSLAAMFPAGDPSAEALVHVLDDFPAADQLLILVSLADNSPGPDPRRLIDFGRRFQEAVSRSPDVEQLADGVFDRPDSDSKQFVEKVIGPAAMFYLDDVTFQAARRRLSRDEIRRQIAQDKTILSAPGPAAQALSKIMAADPLRLHEFMMDRMAGQRPFHTYQKGDAFISPDGRSLLIRVIGKHPPSDLDYSRSLTAGVTRVAQSVNSDGLKLQFTGSYPIAAASERGIRQDMIGTVIGSVVLLQLLFLVAYRSPFVLFALTFGPVAIGILLGFGLYGTLSNGLTPLTGVLGAILAGMGIDYSIQYLSFYESRRTAGGSPRQAAAETAIEMSPAVLAAWATSIVGFVAIGCSRVQALRDFALLGTLGLTGAFLCAVAVLPTILMLTDRRETPVFRGRLRFETAGLLASLARHRTVWLGLSLLTATAAAIVVACSHGDVLPLETDLTVMHPRPNPALDAQYDLARAFGVSPGSLAIYLRATDPQQLVRLAYQVDARLATPETRSAGVSSTYGLATLLPNPELAASRSSKVSDADADRVISDFREALSDNDFAPDAFAGYTTFLRRLLTQRAVPTIEDLVRYRRVAETVLPASAFQGKPATQAITLVFDRNPLDRSRADRDRAIEAIREALRGIDGATVTGLGVVAHDAEETVRRELPRLALAAMLIVAVYLAVHFRNLADALLSLVPTVFGMLIGAGLLRVVGQKLNMVNLVAIPLLIGIDVDYGIFLVNLSRFKRVRQQTGKELARRINPATHAVIICATATILGYISLIWTSVPAEQSLGIAAATGIAACLGGVLFLLVPIFFSLARRS